MNSIKFPDNPTNGDVFEYSEGIYFQYVSATKSWRKIVGLSNVPLASSNNDGLMSKDDFNKLQTLMIPPPQTSLTAEECNTVFREGILKIESSKNDLTITHNLDVLNKSEKEKVDFIIHENTFGIDFSVNLNRLIEELEARGKIKYRTSIGEDGDQGPRGNPGRDRIETGPRGKKGTDGKNAPFAGTLVQDFTAVDQSRIKKVVVDIKNNPDDPRKLIVVFGNIGNLVACPDRIKWKNKKTPWLVALKDKIGPCNYPSSCNKNVCSTEIYYIDTTTIQDQIKDRFNELLLIAKAERESLVRKWLNSMMEMFNAQKQALCCSMEALDSKSKNQEIRDSWSMARYAASQAMYAFKLTSDGDPKYPRADPQQTPGEFAQNYVPPEKGAAKFNGDDPETFECDECFIIVDLLSYNVGQSRPVSIDLPAGSYISTIIQCCPEYEKYGSCGRYSVKFVDHDNDGNKTSSTYTSINKGYLSPSSANASYVGENLAFKHYGGTAYFYLNPPPPNGSPVSINGSLRLCIQPTKCFESCKPVNPSNITAVTAGDISDQTIIDLPSSYIRASHAAFYERGWRIGKACAAHTSILGTQFIVVFRSIGTDVSCGGGEYATTPFIQFFRDELDEQVAIAWPTIEGDGFFGLPRDDGHVKIQLVYDKDLSDLIVSNINNDIVFKTIGDPKSVIKKVVVPILDIGYTEGTGDPPNPGDVKLPGLKWSFGSDVVIIGEPWTYQLSIKTRYITNNQIYNHPALSVNATSTNGYITAVSGNTFNMFIGYEYIDPNFVWEGINLPTNGRTISSWIKHVTETVGLDYLIDDTAGNLTNCFNFQMTIQPGVISGNISVFSPSGSSSSTPYSFAITNYVALGSWVHVVLNRVSDKYIDLYIDGSKVGTIGPIAIGSGTYQWYSNMKSMKVTTNSMDQLRLYDEPLTASDIYTLFNNGRNIP